MLTTADRRALPCVIDVGRWSGVAQASTPRRRRPVVEQVGQYQRASSERAAGDVAQALVGVRLARVRRGAARCRPMRRAGAALRPARCRPRSAHRPCAPDAPSTAAADHDTGPLQAPQPVGQDVRGDAGQRGGQIVEAARAVEQRLDDQQRPAIADAAQRRIERPLIGGRRVSAVSGSVTGSMVARRRLIACLPGPW